MFPTTKTSGQQIPNKARSKAITEEAIHALQQTIASTYKATWSFVLPDQQQQENKLK